MKILITFLLIAVTSFSKSQPFTMQWQNVTGSYPILSVYRAIAATSDINNDFLITGLKDTAISQMIFLNKYHADGSVIFEKKYPEYYCLASSICTDPSGNIYIGGWNYSSDTSKILILKYDSTGNYLWNFSENVNFDSGNDRFEIKLSVDPVGTLYYGFHNADSLIS